jgi:DNA-directed RNA polymerase beta subunit
VQNDGLSKRDMLSFIAAAVDAHGLASHNIEGYDSLLTDGINLIMTRLFNINRMLRNERPQPEGERQIKTFEIHVQFHDVRVGWPQCTTYLTGQFTDLHPGRARLTGVPYSGPVTLGETVAVRAHYADGEVEEKVAEIPPFQIGSLPVMVKSVRCHARSMSRAGLKEMGEDPADPGGYFIAKGEWVVDLLENIRYNAVHLHVRMKPAEHVRAEFLSQPGGAFENSSQIRIRYMTSGQLTVEINSTKFEKVRLPFFLLYRLFGMTSDRAVAETVVFDVGDPGPVTTRMLDVLERAFQLADPLFAPLVPELNPERLVQLTAERLAKFLTNPKAYQTNDDAVRFLNEDLLGSPSRPGGLDRILLPHIGQTGESRVRKLRFLGLLIRKLLLVHFGVLPPTDRDSYRNKRVHGAGVSLAKAFKTQVNNNIVIPTFRALKRELKNNPWGAVTEKTLVDTARNAIATSDLNRAMEQAITSGNKTIVVRRRAATNRVSSQALERKNALNTFSALRTVVTQNAGNASKQTERADKMRRVHPTYVGFICVAQSADTGENVGMRKQLALTAGVCTAGDAHPLKLRLLADPEVAPLAHVAGPEMLRRRLARLSVNGEWIGCCESAHRLVARYRALRREGRVVDPYATIYWDPVLDEVEFWLDVGRLRRPLLIVDSNIAEYDAALGALHAWRQKTGGDPVEAIVVRTAGAPAGVYYPAAGRYYRVDDLAAGARPSLAEAEALAAAGKAAAVEPPAGLQREAARLVEKYGAAGDGAPRRVEFVQNVRFTPEHARAITQGRLTLGDLVREGIVEYITPEEQENCLIAPSIAELRAHRHDVTLQYSHCDVEQAIFGLAAHVSPYGDHTQPARVTYETNQSRQTGGWYVLNFPFRADKNRFFQFYGEVPLVRTLTNRFLPANGMNVVIAYASYGGDNQEDSAIFNQASADRGLFAGVFFRYETAELEKGELFCSPDPLTTKNLKPNASYEKLLDGFIRPGSVARYGDVLIGRVAKLTRGRAGTDDPYKYTDRSVVYRLQEPAFVEAVLRQRGPNDELFGVVKLRFDRPLRTGDKLSSREGNKSIVALMLPQSDMPFTDSGLTPDLLINTHCIAGDTPITTYYGTSRRMDALLEDGGETLWGWDAEKGGFVESHQIKRMTRGEDAVVRVTLRDGRTLRCTPGHQILTRTEAGYEWVEAGLLTDTSQVVMGPDAPLDEPTADEVGWCLRAGEWLFDMSTDLQRERSMAFARVLGLLCTDGCVTTYSQTSAFRAAAYLGHALDVDVFLRDVQVLTGKTPAASRPAGVWVVYLPAVLARAAADVEGMAIGKKVHAVPDWPHFLLEPGCPRAVLREFLGGLFGGDGHAPCLVRQKAQNRKAQNGLDRYTLSGVAFELSIIEGHGDRMMEKMRDLCGMLDRAGVPGASAFGPVRRANSQKAADGLARLQYGVRLPGSTPFADRVGFRYCIQKASRLCAAAAYWRYLENVRRQHGLVFSRTCHYVGEGNSIACSLDLARNDLLEAEPALNAYYSLLTINIVNNRRHRTGRLATLERLDYTRIEDARTFFDEAGCLRWFLQFGEDGARTKAGYVTTHDELHLAPYVLRVAEVRVDGSAMTYDLSVPLTTSFLSNGMTTKNSFPSRMTIGQLIESMQGKICARKGVLADGTAFLPVDHTEMRRLMRECGFRYNGRERMYNGMTGEYFNVAIFLGPTAEQRLQKFVLDDEQSVAGSGPTDATTGQPLGGRLVKGGLRLGEMENWTLVSHGAMLNLYEKTSTDSDGRIMHVCRRCGAVAVHNEYHNVYKCRTCGDLADIAAVESSKSANLLHEELAAASINIRLGLRPREFEDRPAARARREEE